MDSSVNKDKDKNNIKKVNIPWITKFTPTRVEELAINKNIKASLQTMADNREPRNLIFCGPSGVAKTVAVKCLIKEIYRKNREGVLFINSSDDRGIKIVQDTIVSFCKKKTKLGEVHAVTNSSKPSLEVLTTHKKFNVKKFINMRSSYKFCVIATGEFDLYAAKARAYEWDIAAGHTIVKHAGGIVTTFDKKEFKYGKTDYKNLAILVRRSENLER